jgi:preprotein translocase subunit SecA
VMLRIIDTKWREHLYEMDYLQEGINLRAMGQKDPLMEWQREGFEMFGQMMKAVSQDLVRYVMHVQVQVDQPQGGAGAPAASGGDADLSNVSYSAPDESDAGGALGGGALAAAAEAGGQPQASEPRQMQPVVRNEWDKTPRNAPCPCGSGKKYKLCHGR